MLFQFTRRESCHLLLRSFNSIISITLEALSCYSRRVSFHLLRFLSYSILVQPVCYFYQFQPECCPYSFVNISFLSLLTGVVSNSFLFLQPFGFSSYSFFLLSNEVFATSLISVVSFLSSGATSQGSLLSLFVLEELCSSFSLPSRS